MRREEEAKRRVDDLIAGLTRPQGSTHVETRVELPAEVMQLVEAIAEKLVASEQRTNLIEARLADFDDRWGRLSTAIDSIKELRK